MEVADVEQHLMSCIRSNIEESGGDAPAISRDTGIQDEIAGFDSLRAIEVLIELEAEFDCELPPEKVLSKTREDNTVANVSQNILNILIRERL